MDAGAFNVLAMRRATTSDVFRRFSSMSNKQIVESESSGNARISPIKFFANTVLPAPINVIFLGELLMGLRFRCSADLGRQRSVLEHQSNSSLTSLFTFLKVVAAFAPF